MKLKAWQIVLVVLVFGGVLAMVSRAGSEWRKYQGPDIMRVSNAGDLYVQALDRIFVYRPDGSYRETIDLAPWGIEQSTGGFDIFGNGDLLLLSGTHGQGFLLELLTFLHMEKLLLAGEHAPDGRRLMRCSPESGRCETLPALARTFSNTFRVQIDRQDRIFLADTGRDTVSWLDIDGNVLDEIRSGFRFPNQVSLDGDVLQVANTNHNEITRIPLRDNRFAPAAEWQHMKVDATVPAQSGHIWPVEAVTVGDDHYVLQMGHGMANGMIVRYDRAGEYMARFTMPEGSDVVAMVWFGNTLLAADPAQMKVWRYERDGSFAGQLDSAELEAYLQVLAGKKAHYQRVEKYWWWAFSGLLAVGFVVAIIGEQAARKRQQRAAVAEAHATLDLIAQQGESEMPAADDPAIHWLARDERRLRIARMAVLGGVLVMAIGNVLVVANSYAADDTVLGQGLHTRLLLTQGSMMLAMLGFVWFFERLVRRMGIGVLREWVILRNAAGKTAIGRHADISLFPNGIAIGKVVVSIGRRSAGELPKQSLFDPMALQQWLAPRLLQAQEVTGLGALAWYCRHQPVQSALLVLALVAVVAFRFV